MTRKTTGTGSSLLWLDNSGAQDRSSMRAKEALLSDLKYGIDPVSCPKCGKYQKRMIEVLSKKIYYCLFASIGLLLYALMMGMYFRNKSDADPSYFEALFSYPGFIFLFVGIIAVVSSVIWLAVFDPNKNAASRQFGKSPDAYRTFTRVQLEELVQSGTPAQKVDIRRALDAFDATKVK